MKRWLWIALSLATSGLHAADLPNIPFSPARLRKLSLTLRGLPPEAQEYETLAKLDPDRVAVFFAAKTREYLQSPQHVAKMMDRLQELFRVRLSEGLPEKRFRDPLLYARGLLSDTPGIETFDAMNLLFEKILRSNLSWDSLLTYRDYLIVDQQSPSVVIADREFYSQLVDLTEPLAAPYSYGTTKVLRASPWAFAEDDPRLAGALTTARFFSRYNTTNLNKSRGRAAAIFRIFLCDEMKPVVLAKAEDDEELFDLVFPKDMPKTPGVHPIVTDAKKHGSEASCMSCHYKLDPMGRAFMGTGTVLAQEPSPGALVFRREDGSLVNIPGRGLGDVARAITEQREYRRCQTQHFWKWFVDGSGKIAKERLEALTDRFEALGRRPNDFIAYLVQQPEFYSERTAAPSTESDVRPILARCTSCHSGQENLGFPSFTQLPIGGHKNHARWMRKISEQLDLPGDGAEAMMPPEGSAWQLKPEEFARIRRWVAEGARTEDGSPTLDPDTARKLSGTEPGTGEKVAAETTTFHDSHQRYLAGHDLFRVLEQKFPQAMKEKVPYECQQLREKTRSILGLSNPANGERPYRTPSPAFVRWYSRCVLNAVRLELQSTLGSTEKIRSWLGPEVPELDPVRALWILLPEKAQGTLISNWMASWIGPGVLSDEGSLKKELTLTLAHLPGGTSVLEAAQRAFLFLATNDAFLTY